METDEYLFEFFRKRPLELLRLLRLPTEGHWRFESVSVKRKKSEKRFDGLMFREAHEGPQIYAEFLAAPFPKVYWRLFRAIAMYNEQTDEPLRPFIAVVVFLDRAIDPGFIEWTINPPNQLITIYLEERLEQLEAEGGPILALMPLGVRGDEDLRSRARGWAARIQRLPEPPDRVRFLMEMLS